MPTSDDTVEIQRVRRKPWPWLLLALMVVPALWHVVDFENDVDPEFPRVTRPTFSRYPPAAYRLAEPGDTIDRVAIYLSSLTIVLAVAGLCRASEGRRFWVAALAVSLAAFWYAANPGPTFDGWHGLGWRSAFDPESPPSLRATLLAAAIGLAAMIAWGVGIQPRGWARLWRSAGQNRAAALFGVAAILLVVRVVEIPDAEPFGYWPRWAFVWALAAYAFALVRVLPDSRPEARRHWRRLAVPAAVAAWCGLVMGGVALTWYHRPLARLRAVAPGKIYISAMPTARGLEVAHARHHFKTIINLFPEDTKLRSPRLPEELKFAAANGVKYVGSSSVVSSSNAFLDETLALARDPNAWPILVHCHGCMDRTPAWAGIYQFVVENRPIDEIFRFIEGHRGSRPKASVTLLYNRVFSRLIPERFKNDPTSPQLSRNAAGTIDPYDEQLRAERASANRAVAASVGGKAIGSSSGERASLTPRR